MPTQGLDRYHEHDAASAREMEKSRNNGGCDEVAPANVKSDVRWRINIPKQLSSQSGT